MATERERDDHGRFHVTEGELELRRAEVIKLHIAGHGFREIAAKLDIGLGQAHRDFRAVMDRTKAEADSSVDEERRVSLARLEMAIKVLVRMVESGSEEGIERAIADGMDRLEASKLSEKALDAMDRLDRLEKRRAALLGLDAPTKVSAEVSTVGLDELDELRKAAKANECSPSEPQKPPGESESNS